MTPAPPPLPPMPEKKRSGCLGKLLVLVLILSLILNLILFAVIGEKVTHTEFKIGNEIPKFEETTVEAGSGTDKSKIVVIPLAGLISGHGENPLGDDMVDDISRALRQAGDDTDVRAIVLAVDSPGGEVTASDAIYNAVRRARAKKPVVVCMESLAASGGYYVSCGGSWIIANETSITGSIGVIIQTLKYKELFGKIGVEAQTFKSGKFKDILNGARDMTEEEKAYIQALVMQTYDKFLGIVAKERNLPADELRSGVADGRIVSGRDALDYKLVNQLGYIEDAYKKARELGNAQGASIVKYEPSFSLSHALKFLGKSETPKMQVELGSSLLPKLEPGRLYLLPAHYAQ